MTHVSEITLGVETNGNGYFGMGPQLQITLVSIEVKKVKFKHSNVLLKTHSSCSVLSQDSNVVLCFGVRCSEPPKIAIEIYDVMTLHNAH